jgi:DNA ligase 1
LLRCSTIGDDRQTIVLVAEADKSADERRVGIPFRYDHGLYLPEADLWLDPQRGKPFAFISHAHADHVARHETTLASRRAGHLVQTRFGGKSTLALLDYGEPLERHGHRLVLTPAGHVLGSAMIHVTRLADGATLLYTGDFKLRAGLSAEVAVPLRAETLIMECTFGQPQYVFPPFAEVQRAMQQWCRDALEAGETPILLGYALGKAQEIQMALGDALPRAVHPSIAAMNLEYEALGWRLPPWEVLGPGTAAGRVLIVPPSAAKSQFIRRMKQRVTAMVSGWALSPGARFQYQTDEVFPLSDHADFPDLLRLVEAVQPTQIAVTHGPTSVFAMELRRRGWNAWSLTGADQMELLAPTPMESEVPPPGALDDRNHGAFFDLATLGESVAAAGGRLDKVAQLAAYFRTQTGPEEVEWAARFLLGKTAAERDSQTALQTGWALLRSALVEATGRTMAECRSVSRTQNDAGRTAYLMLLGKTVPRPWSLAEVASLFAQLRAQRGPAGKLATLTAAFRSMSAREGMMLVKIITGDTRMGLKEGLLEEALAEAWQRDVATVREAHMLSGDIGSAARRAANDTLVETGLTPMQPVRVMLASPEPDAASIWARHGTSGAVWLEDKYDGIRIQLHRTRERTMLFSRDLRSLHEEFPDLISAGEHFQDEVVLDGELIAFAEGRKLNFFDLQKRLGRREPDLFMADEVPVRCVIFDLLWHEGRSLLQAPLHERRALLEALVLPPGFECIAVAKATSTDEIAAQFLAAKARQQEGLIAKDPASPYTAGRRGKAWLKLKISALSLEVVVTKVQQGHGKRSHLLSDFTFAVRDERDGALRTIGKAYSGLTDVELEELTEHFTKSTLSEKGRVRTVVPDIVLEVTFDSIQPSARHESGLALRFPRIKAWRRDRTVHDLDTLRRAEALVVVKA